MTHGGKRTGAGRKPAPDGTTKIPYTTKLPVELVRYLRSRDNAAITIEQALEKSKAYRQWKTDATKSP